MDFSTLPDRSRMVNANGERLRTVQFAQIVIGSPGSGKSTYCDAALRLLKSIGRPTAYVNFDPAIGYEATEDTEGLLAQADLDIRDLVDLTSVQDEFALGPNGGLIYCMEYIAENIDWVLMKIRSLEAEYLLIDCPGQSELYSYHDAMNRILDCFEKAQIRVVVVHLSDSRHCSDRSRYLTAALIPSLQSMLHLGRPQINVLGKVDLIKRQEIDYGLPFFLAPEGLERRLELRAPRRRRARSRRGASSAEPRAGLAGHLIPTSEHGASLPILPSVTNTIPPRAARVEVRYGPEEEEEEEEQLLEGEELLGTREPEPGGHLVAPEPCDAPPAAAAHQPAPVLHAYPMMHRSLCRLVDDHALVSFRPLSVISRRTLARVIHAADRASGYVYQDGTDLGLSPEDDPDDFGLEDFDGEGPGGAAGPRPAPEQARAAGGRSELWRQGEHLQLGEEEDDYFNMMDIVDAMAGHQPADEGLSPAAAPAIEPPVSGKFIIPGESLQTGAAPLRSIGYTGGFAHIPSVNSATAPATTAPAATAASGGTAAPPPPASDPLEVDLSD
ncbi:hypothetical protein H696_05507 [Fonticula alba]|uniref:GPN-loop GTPase 2 n=1 Tax=Fonticula alba TaxID=691883 RepID=A0A058Z1A2_FONAL|nr:hypothetical protein H696_05507 [Fonticula alba]KCV68039.1 hypothetical protein H696_05507 [Fonticula alba]|eukprot:XP_009497606.1 hypothetical protein H696_05507 [Fonticula alba]